MAGSGSKDYFDTVSTEWDALSNSFFGDSPRENIFRTMHFEEGQIVADVGCGTGYLTEWLPLHQVSVIAIDQSQSMLDTMRRKFGDNAPIDYRIGTAEMLPVSADSVDVVMANMYLHHVELPERAILEMSRILKPGGMLVMTDLTSHNYEFLRTEQHDRWMGFEDDEVRTWMLNAGLSEVSISDIGSNCCTSSGCSGEMAQVGIFMALGIKKNQK